MSIKGSAVKMFLNLPVKDLNKTMEFFRQLGFTFELRFTDEKAACLIIGDNIYAMLIREEFFKTFTSKAIIDTETGTEAIISIQVEGRDTVDELAELALKAGGKAFREPKDQGFMYGRSFQDPDGHLWEVFHMEPAQPGTQG